MSYLYAENINVAVVATVTFANAAIKKEFNKWGKFWIYGPEGTINKKEDGFFEIDYIDCKGCGICAKECPTNNIEMIRESNLKDD